MSILTDTLDSFRKTSHTERENGSYSEHLAKLYFQNEPRYKDLYSDVWLWEWVMERQAVTTHKDSGILNDANLWATETMGDASYPLKLFQRVITVSIETMKIVRALSRLDIAAASG